MYCPNQQNYKQHVYHVTENTHRVFVHYLNCIQQYKLMVIYHATKIAESFYLFEYIY